MFQPEYLKFCRDFQLKFFTDPPKMVLHGSQNNIKLRMNSHTEAKNRDQLVTFFNKESNKTNKVDIEGFYMLLKHLSIFLFKNNTPEETMWAHLGLFSKEYKKKNKQFGQAFNGKKDDENLANPFEIPKVHPIPGNNRLSKQSEDQRQKKLKQTMDQEQKKYEDMRRLNLTTKSGYSDIYMRSKQNTGTNFGTKPKTTEKKKGKDISTT